MGTADGFSQYPYIRESRRIEARKTIVEQEVAAPHQPHARAAPFSDSVGVGWYAIDIHGQATDVVYTAPTKPFQIPLGALVSRHLDNLLAALQEHRHHAHHQWLLPPASRGVEYRRSPLVRWLLFAWANNGPQRMCAAARHCAASISRPC